MDKIACSHPVQFHGLCALCGKEVVDEPIHSVPLPQADREIRVTYQEAERMWAETYKRLIKERKLSLILDLDQTVLHASVNSEIAQYTQNHDDILDFVLPDNPQLKYYIKLRPYLKQFLGQISQLYEFHIYTMGTRAYANAIKQIIDPDNVLFRERIITRDENGPDFVKDIKNIFPCDRSMVLILDDRNDVWQWSENLIRVMPYSFFYGVEDINGPGRAAPSQQPSSSGVLSVGAKKPPQLPFPTVDADDELFTLIRVLTEIHQQFFAGDLSLYQSQDASRLLMNKKQSVLTGMRICFSSMFATVKPNGDQLDMNLVHDWRWIASFGATLMTDFEIANITHLVAARPDTLKVDQVRRYNMQTDNKHKVWIVRPQYVFDCMSKWKKLNELDYLLIPNDAHSIGAGSHVGNNNPFKDNGPHENYQIDNDILDGIDGELEVSDDDADADEDRDVVNSEYPSLDKYEEQEDEGLRPRKKIRK